jgi:ribose-phosphate pyrophosphokinase
MNYFPDGQLNYKHQGDVLDEHLIKRRFSSWNDLQAILAETAYVKSLGVDRVNLFVPYFFGSRADRAFEDGGINYFRDVVAPIINAQGYSRVQSLSPHSLAVESAINRYTEVDSFHFKMHAFVEISLGFKDGVTILSPDFGAYKSTFEFCKRVNDVTCGLAKIQFLSAKKIRTVSGEIIKTEIDGTPKFNKCLIIDDICDGGRTFIEISKALSGFQGELHLFVTHGIFSKGFDELFKHFTKIYTTNSIKDFPENEQI